jgi:hypothetical protein
MCILLNDLNIKSGGNDIGRVEGQVFASHFYGKVEEILKFAALMDFLD